MGISSSTSELTSMTGGSSMSDIGEGARLDGAYEEGAYDDAAEDVRRF